MGRATPKVLAAGRPSEPDTGPLARPRTADGATAAGPDPYRQGEGKDDLAHGKDTSTRVQSGASTATARRSTRHAGGIPRSLPAAAGNTPVGGGRQGGLRDGGLGWGLAAPAGAAGRAGEEMPGAPEEQAETHEDTFRSSTLPQETFATHT